MIRLLLTLVVALALAGAPVLAQACQIACLHDTHGSGSEHVATHACPEMAMSSSVVARAGVHVCGHDDELPSASQTTPHGLDAPDVVPTLAAAVPQTVRCAGPAVAVAPSPPERAARTTQIRV